MPAGKVASTCPRPPATRTSFSSKTLISSDGKGAAIAMRDSAGAPSGTSALEGDITRHLVARQVGHVRWIQRAEDWEVAAVPERGPVLYSRWADTVDGIRQFELPRPVGRVMTRQGRGVLALNEFHYALIP